MRQVLSGRGGATAPHGHQQGVRVLLPTNPYSGKVEGNYIRLRCNAVQNGEASGLVPEVLHNNDLIQTAFCLRIPGDVRIIGGSMVFTYDMIAKLRPRKTAVTSDQLRDQPIAWRVLGEEDYSP